MRTGWSIGRSALATAAKESNVVDDAPAREQPEWIPTRDYLGRRPIVQSWPGLRPEIKRAWEALAKTATAARVVATWGEWMDFFGIASSTLRGRLQSMAGISLIRWSAADDGSRLVTIELVDPLLLERTPVGTAARVRRPRVVGSFERQGDLWQQQATADDDQPTLRLAVCTPEAERYQTPEAERDQTPEAEPVQLQTPPERTMDPPAIIPQCAAGAGAPSFDEDLTKDLKTSTSKEPLEGDAADSAPPTKNDDDDDEGFGKPRVRARARGHQTDHDRGVRSPSRRDRRTG
jgi:hypothetical protein